MDIPELNTPVGVHTEGDDMVKAFQVDLLYDLTTKEIDENISNHFVPRIVFELWAC